MYVCLCEFMCTMYAGAQGNQRAQDPLELELQLVEGHLISVLRMEPSSLATAVRTLNY